jgi:hypothetical protein
MIKLNISREIASMFTQLFRILAVIKDSKNSVESAFILSTKGMSLASDDIDK